MLRTFLFTCLALQALFLSLASVRVEAAETLNKSLGWPGEDLNGARCHGPGYGPTSSGPYDYRNPDHRREMLHTVEMRHFTPKVERLEGGESTAYLVDDLFYTLRAFPNHHRALYAMLRYQLRNPRPPGARYPPAECFLQRAAYFARNDATVYVLHGIYLHKLRHYKSALAQYRKAEALQPNYAELEYNMGLLFLDWGKAKQAVPHARKAYRLGYRLPALKRRLREKGLWDGNTK